MTIFGWGLAAGAWLCWLATHAAARWGRRRARTTTEEAAMTPEEIDAIHRRDGTRWATLDGVRFIAVDDLVTWLNRDDHHPADRGAARRLAEILATEAFRRDIAAMEIDG